MKFHHGKNVVRNNLFLCFLLTYALTGCQTASVLTMSPSELQSVQSEEFEKPKKVVFTAALSVLEDDGYIADSASFETGQITANVPMRNRYVPFVGHGISVVKVCVHIKEISTGRTRMTVNFFNSHAVQIRGGRKEEEHPIEDEKLYHDFYGKVEQSISVRKNWE